MTPQPLQKNVEDVSVAGFDVLEIHSRPQEFPQYVIYYEAVGAEVNPHPCYDDDGKANPKKVHINPLGPFPQADQRRETVLRLWVPEFGTHDIQIGNCHRVIKDADVQAQVIFADNGYGYALDLTMTPDKALLKARHEAIMATSHVEHDPDWD